MRRGIINQEEEVTGKRYSLGEAVPRKRTIREGESQKRQR
jgi:hypothetical protein